MLHNVGALISMVGGTGVSGESSGIQKSSVQGWVGAGIWLDFILVGMVLGSAVGLAYSFLMH